MNNSPNKEIIPATELPGTPPTETGIFADAKGAPNLIADAVKDGIAAALEQLGIQGSQSAILSPEVKMTYEDIDKLDVPWDPKGESTKRKPWGLTVTDKETGEILTYRIIIPPGLFTTARLRPEGKTRALALKNAKKLMLRELNRMNQIAAMTPRNSARFADAVEELKKIGLKEDNIWESFREGTRVLAARANPKERIKKDVDVVALGIKFGILQSKTVAEVVEDYRATLPLTGKARKYLRGDKPRSNANAILNKLVLKHGGESFLDLLAGTKLSTFFNVHTHSIDAGKPSSRARAWTELSLLLEFAHTKLYFPKVHHEVMGTRPTKGTKDIVAPSPEILDRFLQLIHDEAPTYGPMATACIFIARPQEVYKTLENFRSAITTYKIQEAGKPDREELAAYLPVSNAKGGAKYPRHIRLRPAALAHFALDPRWHDPNATDFRPLKKNGQPVLYSTAELTLNKFLVRAGWQGGTKESLRKSFLSAQVAVGNKLENIWYEAGHVDGDMLKTSYNAGWTREKGEAFFKNFPRGTKNPPTENLHEPYPDVPPKKSEERPNSR